ncbi:MAG: Sec-independent protein translocase protein TatB [Gammaproteobacteria bacterium]|nr:Sec-independent protein translocase protein TatB [Gammaproteobacteria bacterium]
MFDIGFPELVLVAVVGLLVIGPERLPEALRTLGLWFGRMRRSFLSVKAEIEKEIGMDEVRRQLHNEAVMEEMQRIEREVKATAKEATIHPNPSKVGTPVAAPVADPETKQPAPEKANDG